MLPIHGNKLSGMPNSLVLIESCTSSGLQSSDEDNTRGTGMASLIRHCARVQHRLMAP